MIISLFGICECQLHLSILKKKRKTQMPALTKEEKEAEKQKKAEEKEKKAAEAAAKKAEQEEKKKALAEEKEAKKAQAAAEKEVKAAEKAEKDAAIAAGREAKKAEAEQKKLDAAAKKEQDALDKERKKVEYQHKKQREAVEYDSDKGFRDIQNQEFDTWLDKVHRDLDALWIKAKAEDDARKEEERKAAIAARKAPPPDTEPSAALKYKIDSITARAKADTERTYFLLTQESVAMKAEKLAENAWLARYTHKETMAFIKNKNVNCENLAVELADVPVYGECNKQIHNDFLGDIGVKHLDFLGDCWSEVDRLPLGFLYQNAE